MNATDSPGRPRRTNLMVGLRNKVREFLAATRNTPYAFRLVWEAGRSAALLGVTLTLLSAVLPAAPQRSRPISSRICATLSPTAGVGASERSTMPNGTPNRCEAS